MAAKQRDDLAVVFLAGFLLRPRAPICEIVTINSFVCCVLDSRHLHISKPRRHVGLSRWSPSPLITPWDRDSFDILATIIELIADVVSVIRLFTHSLFIAERAG